MNICSIFGICERTSDLRFEWHGLTRAVEVIDAFRREVEADGDSPELLQLFDYSLNPSLQRISIAFVKLFFYLNTRSLDVRKVGRFFAQGKTKYKTIIRKLYTAVMIMEIAGILSRTSAVSEIHLNAPLWQTDKSPQFCGLPSILNSPEEVVRIQGFERRRRIVEDYG
jgi:hypothetical protein